MIIVGTLILTLTAGYAVSVIAYRLGRYVGYDAGYADGCEHAIQWARKYDAN